MCTHRLNVCNTFSSSQLGTESRQRQEEGPGQSNASECSLAVTSLHLKCPVLRVGQSSNGRGGGAEVLRVWADQHGSQGHHAISLPQCISSLLASR